MLAGWSSGDAARVAANLGTSALAGVLEGRSRVCWYQTVSQGQPTQLSRARL